MKAVIIDYDGGNIFSVVNAFKSIAADKEIIVSHKISDIESATHLILPGVGAFRDCIDGISKIDGLIDVLKEQILVKKKPFLGICVGMQVLADFGNEHGQHQGLGLISGNVEKISAKDGLKVPHMGWNQLSKHQEHAIFDGIADGEHFYFANSYHFICEDERNVLGHVDYGSRINAILAKDKIIAIQFHPEKSGVAGLRILQNFLNFK